ncbi:MAG TPA: diaminopimelate epimerase [Nitrospinota bacterium]|nr:diaminopimelate epimerase [Nitrospinota bacterium]
MRFTKMHGIGNSYIYINCFNEEVKNPSALAREISDKNFGVGSDGLVLIIPSDKADFKMRIFNADGSEAEMCGNGIRCLGKYVYDHKMTNKEKITVETLSGIKTLDLYIGDGKVGKVRVNMGCPTLERGDIPMKGQEGRVINEELEVDDKTFNITCVSMGNPHCVIYVDDVRSFPVEKYGPLIETSTLFPNRTNVEFVQMINSKEVEIKTWERGSGETLACGTGASAVTVAGVLNHKTERILLTHLKGGDLEIEWKEDNSVYMKGPAREIFTGEWNLG